jgi:hypothetical protein
VWFWNKKGIGRAATTMQTRLNQNKSVSLLSSTALRWRQHWFRAQEHTQRFDLHVEKK